MVGSGKDEFDLEQQSRVPDRPDRRHHNNTFAQEKKKQGQFKGIIVEWRERNPNITLSVKDGKITFEEEFIDYFVQHEGANWSVGGRVSVLLGLIITFILEYFQRSR